MNRDVLVFLLACFCVEFSFCTEAESSPSKLLSRRKRYVAFPEGSSFSVAGCMTVGLIGQPAPTSAPGTFTFGLNWAIAYELPNVTETAALYVKKFKKPIQQRRSRRNLYEKLESIIDESAIAYELPNVNATAALYIKKFKKPIQQRNLYEELESIIDDMGYNGRQCILKTLCETTQRIVPHGTNVMEEMFRTLFTMPITKIVASEPIEHAIYDSAHRLGLLLENCDSMFSCPISLVDWAKGYYNAPAPISNTARSPWTLFSNTFEQ